MIEVLVRGRVRDFRIGLGLGLGLGFRLTLVFFVVGASRGFQTDQSSSCIRLQSLIFS